MKRLALLTVALLCVVLIAHIATGQIVKKKAEKDSRYLQYEGVLTDPSGERMTGEYGVTFTIYDSPDAAVPQWIEVQDVSVNEGEFKVTLGKNTPLPSLDMENSYIGVSIAGEELLPRQVVGSSRTMEETSLRDFPRHKEPFLLRDDDWNYWDNPPHMFAIPIEGNVGIGTEYPWWPLHVESPLGLGILSRTNDNSYPSMWGENLNNEGCGIIGVGNNIGGGSWPSGGCGISGVGTVFGVFGRATNTSGYSSAGGIFKCDNGPEVKIAYRTSQGTDYKIQGGGAVSSVMSTSVGRVGLIAPESPEAWVQDFGNGKLVSGRATVDLDQTFLECVTISNDLPLKVFITFTSPPPVSYYVNKGTDGFEVVATSGEGLTASFDYFVSARWKGWEDIRFDP